MDIISGLAAASQALDVAKKLRQFEKSFDEAEFKLQIAELYTALSEVKIALADAKETIAEKDAEIRRLTEIQLGNLKVVRRDGFPFGVENGKVLPIPFCPTCEQAGTQNLFSSPIKGKFYCSVCHRTEVRIPTAPPPPP
ncbi:hypothetical protein [uncultured Nitratireductor sp.]|uniref:hypothetical protein n=1 Tax=uncultured Nitratireductor sp. TaxID=520953 RepID=UPI0026342890|nr:hypothetical protein [uncultured Nitratireductor sp.]